MLRHGLRPQRRSDPTIAYTTDRAHAFSFRPSARQAAFNEPRRKPRCVLGTLPADGLVRVSKLERFGGLLSGSDPICAEVRNASLEFIGIPNELTLIEYESKADAKSEAQARRLLSQVRIQHKNGVVRLVSPLGRDGSSCLTEFAIVCLGRRPVKARGDYAAMRFADMSGGVDVQTNHARITLLNVTSTVNARVPDGIIDYSGHEGTVSLFAGWEVNLDFTLLKVTGQMEATAEACASVTANWLCQLV